MIPIKIIFGVFLLFSLNVQAEINRSNPAAMIKALGNYEAQKDDLALRIMIKRISGSNLTYSEWNGVRQLIHRRPGIGYNILFNWERVPFKDTRSAQARKTEIKVNNWLRTADEKMIAGQFQTAFTMYQKAAHVLKNEKGVQLIENQLLYQVVLHSMARALYGSGRFEDSLIVYDWISKNYPRYRQVLFEKMWAAFRAHHANIALGAIASQQSAFFSDYMEPESYLVQLYLYKKLCREEELKAVRKMIVQFRDNLKNGRYTYVDWAKSDLENYSLYRLANLPVTGDDGGPVSRQNRLDQQGVITELLKTKFAQEKKRLLPELNQVLAYSFITAGTDALQLEKNELNREQLRKAGNEYWPADDSEAWLDEIGNLTYIGSSQCTVK
jgi:hypothetical protein